jgi:ubiquinone/menaquinone biosynthesis C-methylase UbiE
MTERPPRVDYDEIAPAYDKRYDRNRYSEVRAALIRFVGDAKDIVEVGCGTGHWLAELRSDARSVVGIDQSFGMLRAALTNAPAAMLIRGGAAALPIRSQSADRLFCVNAFHHFDDKPAFVAEARRALRGGGAIMIVGLDPHTGLDQWWIYDYFPSTVPIDLARYSSTAAIKSMLERAGFSSIETIVAQHFPAEIPFDKAVERGYLDRHATSQLTVIPEDEYREGMQRLRAERPVIRADLRVYSTVGWVETSELPL